MNDAQSREILARAYIQDAVAWAEQERLLALARAHADRTSRPERRRELDLFRTLRAVVRRLVPLGAQNA
jgi:hypothetical protein